MGDVVHAHTIHWAARTKAAFTEHIFPGGHFYLTANWKNLAAIVASARLGADFWQRAMPALSAARQKKVRGFRFDRDRVLSSTAYLLLRLGLWWEYGCSAAPELYIEPHGKPVLPEGFPHFSLSTATMP